MRGILRNPAAIVLAWLAVAAALLGVAAPAAHAADIEAAPERQSIVRTDVNDFAFESFDAEYRLGRGDDGRSTLHTTERLVALFPDHDQNRGIIRNIPHSYDGHPTDLEVVSVTDDTGAPRDFAVERGNEYLSVTIAVPKGQYVHGRQTYVIEYTQRDVTKHFADTGADEFYWDVNGTDWWQQFGRVSARIAVDDELVPALNGNQSCYRGRYGSTQGCAITGDEDGAGGTFAISEEGLWPQENITFAIGFEPGTFSSRPFSLFERVPPLLFGGFTSLAGAVLVGTWALTFGRRSARTGRAIIAQYEPPEGVDAALSAQIMGEPKRAMTATLLDLAVRGKILILHDRGSDSFGARPIDDSGLSNRERMAFGAITRAASSGEAWFGGTSTALGDAAVSIRNSAANEVEAHGYVSKPSKWLGRSVLLLCLLGLGLLVIYAIRSGSEAVLAIVLAVGINALVWILIAFFLLLSRVRRRTREGALLHDHLLGLREYIRLAEADRIRMLQGVSGAEVDERFIVRIYERLLPYAAIFGYEREWQAELAKHYSASSPSWIEGSDASLNHLSFTQLHSSVASSPVTHVESSSSSGSSSSSSGGSSGGGSSGGGGGGGGGGGI